MENSSQVIAIHAFTGVLTAGVHTVKLKWKVSTSSFSGTVYGSTANNRQPLRMSVAEQPF